MGTDKAHVTVGSRTMLEHVAAALSRVVDEVVVAGREGPVSGLRSLADSGDAHLGPLAGLAAATTAYPASLLVVVAVDQPWIRHETLRHLLAIAGPLPTVPVDDGIRQTTCATYPTDALDGIVDELAGGGSVQSLLDRVSFRPVIDNEWKSWGEDGRSWFSADTTADLDEGVRRFGLP